MAEELPNIRVHTKKELSTFLSVTDERKGAEPFTYTWKFDVKTMKQVCITQGWFVSGLAIFMRMYLTNMNEWVFVFIVGTV